MVILSAGAVQANGTAASRCLDIWSAPSHSESPAKTEGSRATDSRRDLTAVPGLERSANFEDWFRRQAEVSLDRMIANISPEGAARGAVVASPSRAEPDYWYHWIRDAALVMDVIVREHGRASGDNKARLRKMMNDYIDFSIANQRASTLTGLGEPKFYVDGRGYELPWGRPQNDGPALRALTLTRFALQLVEQGEINLVKSKLYDSRLPANTPIKADLEYVAHHWHEASFDLWEEVKGDHFYTRLVQMASLRDGSTLAYRLGDKAAADYYRKQADRLEGELNKFWDPNRGIIQVTLNRVEGMDSKTSGLDAAVILGVLHAESVSDQFSVVDDRVLATAQQLEDAFRRLYPINEPGRSNDVGVAIGRYPEDVYSGQSNVWVGNPWVLTTAALAELHYKLAKNLKKRSSFAITANNLKFVRSVVGPSLAGEKLKVGRVLKSGAVDWKTFEQGLVQKGDLFMKRVRLHGNPDGSFSEQIDRHTGFMVSARDLTWSHASVITAQRAR